MKSPETFDDVAPYAMEVIVSERGSGATVDSPFQLGLVHPILASSVERAIVSLLFQSQEWTPVQRLYHKNGQVFEWQIKLKSGDVRPVFFDIGKVNDTAPISEDARQTFNESSDEIPVPDTTLVSRFPLIKVEAKSAAEAADFISTHLKSAARDGWQLGQKWVLVDGWRNEYEFSRSGEKTKMCFDMRSCLVLNTFDLTMLTLLAGTKGGETFVKEHARILVETGQTRRAPPGSAVEKAVQTKEKSRVRASTKPKLGGCVAQWGVGILVAIGFVAFMGIHHGWDRHSYPVPVPLLSGPSDAEIQAKLVQDGLVGPQVVDRWPRSESSGDQKSRKGTPLYPVRVRVKTSWDPVSEVALDLYFYKDDFGELHWYVYRPGE